MQDRLKPVEFHVPQFDCRFIIVTSLLNLRRRVSKGRQRLGIERHDFVLNTLGAISGTLGATAGTGIVSPTALVVSPSGFISDQLRWRRLA